MITGLYAAVLGLIFIALSHYVIAGRRRYHVGLGDGGHADLAARIRIHGNFAENVPLALILMMLVEMQGAPLLSLHAMGLIVIVARLMHIWALAQDSLRARVVGVTLTHTVIFTASVFLVWRFIA